MLTKLVFKWQQTNELHTQFLFFFLLTNFLIFVFLVGYQKVDSVLDYLDLGEETKYKMFVLCLLSMNRFTQKVTLGSYNKLMF